MDDNKSRARINKQGYYNLDNKIDDWRFKMNWVEVDEDGQR